MKQIKVGREDEGLRLDMFLVRRLGLARQAVKNLIDVGGVRVNGRRVVIAKWEMIGGDSLQVREDLARGRLRQEGSRGPREIARDFITVVYEDRDVVVTEKPAGAVIQPGDRHQGPTYVDSLRSYLMRKHKSRGAYVKPVHRLDKETSGLMVFAKSKEGERLVDQFRNHTIERSYLAVVEGQVEAGEGKISLPIAKGDFGFGKKASIARGGEGQESLTLFTVKERYANATLLKLDLKTGRTHQARVHLAAVGHPVVGDRLYGKSGGVSFGRQALHSHFISFKHPATGRTCRYSSDLPNDMKALVDQLRGS